MSQQTAYSSDGCYLLFFFFFQAEDGIRDDLVTGVQTCALPICVGSNEQDLFGLASFVPPQFHLLSLRAPFSMGPSAHAWFQFTVDANGTRHIHASQDEHSRALVAQTVHQPGARLDIPPQRTVPRALRPG